jgi:hypothetical protein
VLATGPTGRYRLTWTVLRPWAVTSLVTRGLSRVTERTGPGLQTWDGQGGAPGEYRLRVLYAEPGGGRVLLSTFPLVVDAQRPRIAAATAATAAPDPFEPRPHDGDRDTTVFAMTSRAGPAPGRRLQLGRRRGPGPAQRPTGGRAPAGRLDRAGVVGRLASGTPHRRDRGHRRRRGTSR